MAATNPLWLRDPLAILADRAELGIVIANGQIVELVPANQSQTNPNVTAFDASNNASNLNLMQEVPAAFLLQRHQTAAQALHA